MDDMALNKRRRKEEEEKNTENNRIHLEYQNVRI
jgi:hypothetical protein